MSKSTSLTIHSIEMREAFGMALNAIRAHKLRSVLTLLGVAVGVFSIIAVMTAMGVLRNSIESGLTQLGAHTFQIQKFPAGFSAGPGERDKYRNRKDLTYEQGLTVKERSTLARAVGLEAWMFGRTVKVLTGEKTNPNVSVAGEDLEGFLTNNWEIGDGRLFTEEELKRGERVIVLGGDVVTKVFQQTDPIGRKVRIDGYEYTVIGTIARKGGALGGSRDNFAAMPLTTFFQTYGKERSIHIMVKALNADVYEDCLEQVRGILRTARHVPPGNEDDFAVFSNDSLIQQFNEITYLIRIGIIVVSCIALLAAGVGIMNIMLVSVTERTREIGIRKAVGARKNNILSQFILEAIVLCEIGGLIGVGLGIVGGNVVALLLEIPAIFPYDWAAIGLLACSVVGITFGVYPAWKAANLDPIEALRYE
jgi:putative ABC transport system permease protein